MKQNKIYVASPYSGTNEEQKQRYKDICEATGHLKYLFPPPEYIFFSPIAHSHGIASYGKHSGTHKTWIHENYSWIEWCTELWVVMLDGWDKSKGVIWEINTANELKKNIKYYKTIPFKTLLNVKHDN